MSHIWPTNSSTEAEAVPERPSLDDTELPTHLREPEFNREIPRACWAKPSHDEAMLAHRGTGSASQELKPSIRSLVRTGHGLRTVGSIDRHPDDMTHDVGHIGQHNPS